MESTGMIDGKIEQEGRKLWQYLATFSACLLSVAAGNSIAWTSPVLPTLTAKNSWLPITEEQGSWIGSLLAIGAMLGAVSAGSLAEKIGRRRSILLLSAPYLLSWLIIGIARNVWTLYVARLIAGVAVGGSCVIVPTYVTEIAEVSTRGTLGSIFQLFMTIGILMSFVIGAIVSYTTLAICSALVEVVFIVTFFWMPESPQWLVGQGRKTDASEALAILRGDAYELKYDLATMQKEAEDRASKKTSIHALVKTSGSRRAIYSSFGSMILQQFSGINAVIFYTVHIFKDAGSTMSPALSSIVVSLVQMVMSFVAALIVDKAGRKPLLMASSIFMGISLFALGLYFHLKSHDFDVSELGWLPLTSLTLFMIAFSIGLGPIPWMLMGELFATETKAVASSLAVMVNWILVFLVTKTFPAMTRDLGTAATFWIFGSIMGIGTVFIYFIIPETKGRTLQLVQDKLHGIHKSNKKNKRLNGEA